MADVGADDTITDAEIAAAEELGDELFEQVIDEAEFRGIDVSGVVFTLFVNAAHLLASYGWTPGELAKEAVDHAIDQREFEASSKIEQETGLIPEGSA